MADDKVLENRLRRIAARRGYRLEKSRRRDPQAVDFGGYMLMDADSYTVVRGGSNDKGFNYCASLEDVAAFFDNPRSEAAQS